MGLGCMGMTPLYGTPDPDEAAATVHAALEAGINMLDTADAYAMGRNEELVGAAIAGVRQRVVLATKFGNIRNPDGSQTVDGRPDYVGLACENSLRRLGIDHIDLWYLHRVDSNVPIEETVGAMARQVEAGRVRYLGLSEAAAATIRRAHAEHPIAAVQTEYSLATREVEIDVLPTCRELGIGFVAYSPLSRGLLTAQIDSLDGLAENDRRRDMPRFQKGNLETNLAMIKDLAAFAADKGVSPACLALAWVLAQGEDVVPIPGCSRRQSLADTLRAQELGLGAKDLLRLQEIVDASRIAGTRYPAQQMKRLGL